VDEFWHCPNKYYEHNPSRPSHRPCKTATGRPAAPNDNRGMTTPHTPATSGTSSSDFSSLPLAPAMLANLEQLGYLQMTPIQAASLP